MADDPYAKYIKKEEPKIDVKPFSTWNRIVASTFFDTQTKRRDAYVKRFGYTLNPEDPNEMRPIGSKGSYTQIDPGGFFNISQYKDKPSELIPDAIEGVLDTIQGSLTEAAGDVTALGGVLATEGAAAPAAPALRAGGRAAAFQTIDRLKNGLGDWFLDERIPINQSERLAHTAVQAVAPEIIGPLAKGATKVGVKVLDSVGNSFANMLNLGKGEMSEIIRNAIAKNPIAFASMEKINNGGAWLKENFIDRLSGKLGKDIPGKFKELGEDSLFNQKIKELGNERKTIVSLLDNVPQLNTKASEIESLLDAAKSKISSGISTNEGKEQALEAIDKQILTLQKRTGGNPDALIPFSHQDQLISDLQKQGYSSDADAKTFLKNLSGNVNKFLKDRAKDYDQNLIDPVSGKPLNSYSKVKELESKVFNAFEQASDNVNENSLMSSLVRGEYGELPRAATGGTTSKVLSETMDTLDDALGTNFGNEVQSGQIYGKLYKSINEGPKTAKGIIRKSADSLSQILPGAATFALTKNPVAAGGAQVATTLAKNAVENVLENPQNALKGLAASQAAKAGLENFAEAVGGGSVIPAISASGIPEATRAAVSALSTGSNTLAQPIAEKINSVLSEPEEDPFLKYIKEGN